MGLGMARLHFLSYFLFERYNSVLPHRLNLLGFFQDRDKISFVRGTLYDLNAVGRGEST
jgi:hypothetical protein